MTITSVAVLLYIHCCALFLLNSLGPMFRWCVPSSSSSSSSASHHEEEEEEEEEEIIPEPERELRESLAELIYVVNRCIPPQKQKALLKTLIEEKRVLVTGIDPALLKRKYEVLEEAGRKPVAKKRIKVEENESIKCIDCGEKKSYACFQDGLLGHRCVACTKRGSLRRHQ